MGSCFCSCVHHVASAVQVLLAVAIIVIVATKFSNVEVSGTSIDEATCYLGTAVDSNSLCIYTYTLAGVSVVVSLLISLLQCCTCNLCGLGGFLDLIFAGVGSAWWIVGASVVQSNVSDAANQDLTLQDYRTAVVVCCWVEAGLFVLLVITGLVRICGCLKDCLCCGSS